MISTLELQLDPVDGDSRPLSDWLTTFPLACVVLDPYTHESAWILDTSKRILEGFREADCRPCWVLTCSSVDARTFLGPYAAEVLAFSDPGRAIAKTFGVKSAPAFLLVRQDGAVTAKAEGWDPETWREVADAIAELTHWSRPSIPAEGDPAPYPGTPIDGTVESASG
ncbi:MAG: hypothetical protein OXB92_08755 [Acidimicrobiaceae bacterium]|nr:hypothetical protein [Acidimicrobiia bacterium]MCY4493929.1 hypothetical protein [Acidimicrobiaceae bacterium]